MGRVCPADNICQFFDQDDAVFRRGPDVFIGFLFEVVMAMVFRVVVGFVGVVVVPFFFHHSFQMHFRAGFYKIQKPD